MTPLKTLPRECLAKPTNLAKKTTHQQREWLARAFLVMGASGDWGTPLKPPGKRFRKISRGAAKDA
ncbi:MAG: hypothetical protein JNK87_33180 [Bryobacterales bacterium]|nr:hypothetical protein [Bryobacterales bacterium]